MARGSTLDAVGSYICTKLRYQLRSHKRIVVLDSLTFFMLAVIIAMVLFRVHPPTTRVSRRAPLCQCSPLSPNSLLFSCCTVLVYLTVSMFPLHALGTELYLLQMLRCTNQISPCHTIGCCRNSRSVFLKSFLDPPSRFHC